MDEIQERTVYWSSSENNSTNAWNVNFGSGNMNNNNKFNAYRVRAVAALQKTTFDISFHSIFEAFEDCIRKKKNSPQCAEFCIHYLPKLVELWEEVRTGTYRPAPSDCFLVNTPTWREVFAAAFRDRIIHHWICLREIPLFEDRYKQTGNISFNCRKGYGQFSAIERLETLIQECSENYTGDCWIVELDISGFFMSISKSLLWEMIELFLRDNYTGDDIECLIYLHRVSLFNQPQKGCRFRTDRYLWPQHIPPNKSLFKQPADRGIAIGNHTAQQEANFYNTVLDYYLTAVINLRAVRFVDDIRLVTRTKEEGLEAVVKIREFLHSQLLLELHPKKIRIHHYKQGAAFVGAVLKGNRRYVSNRTRGRLVGKIHYYNRMADDGRAAEYVETFVAIINSYYGLMGHFQTYTIRRKYALWILEKWSPYLYFTDEFHKAVVKAAYKSKTKLRASIRQNGAASIFTEPYLID